MSLKRSICVFVVLVLMVCALPFGADATGLTGEDVKTLLAELPTVEALKAMSLEEQRLVYDQTQAAYDAYQALSQEEQAALEHAEEIFQSLFDYFNTLTMPLEEAPAAEEAKEEKEGIPWAYTALVLALITTILQNKFIHGRRR